MAYNNLISRTDAGALIPEDVASEILGHTREMSAALTLFRNRPMGRNVSRLPVKSVLPTAYFVSGDTGLKQTTEVNWDNVYLTAEEIAAIVPIPENVADDIDSGIDVWGEIRDDVAEAIGRAFDAAVFFGINKPSSYPTDIVAGAVAAGNVVARGTATQANGGLAEDINQLMGAAESDGYDVNGFVTKRGFRSRLRGVRATDGQKLLDLSTGTIEGAPVRYAMNGLWPTGLSSAELIGGDFTQGIVGIRQDVTYKLLTEAVIQDNTGAIIYNLAQQDMVGLRVKARLAFAVPNPTNFDQPTAGSRYPFAVLRSPAV